MRGGEASRGRRIVARPLTSALSVANAQRLSGASGEREIAQRSRGPMFACTILTLFPQMFPGPLGQSLAGDALARGLWSLEPRDIREHGIGRHRAVDDTPAGGGPGMVMRADVIAASLDAAIQPDDPRPRLIMSPRGAPFTQGLARQWAAGPGLIVVCPRFEGVDERIIGARGLIEVSVGDYVLSGGEIAALAVLDACVRLIPGVMGKIESGDQESFEAGLLEYPHYTRPREWESRSIPDVLLSGDHKAIETWRREEAERITRERRPDLK
jgi:tRNA (guanine37-N1)-methyltransferase